MGVCFLDIFSDKFSLNKNKEINSFFNKRIRELDVSRTSWKGILTNTSYSLHCGVKFTILVSELLYFCPIFSPPICFSSYSECHVDAIPALDFYISHNLVKFNSCCSSGASILTTEGLAFLYWIVEQNTSDVRDMSLPKKQFMLGPQFCFYTCKTSAPGLPC